MKVLLQNRENALKQWGGDTTQMVCTRQELQRLGVEAEVSLDPEPSLAGYDLVHVFNIQTAPFSVRQVRNARKQGVPVALSTIYWAKDHMLGSDDYLLYHSNPLVRKLAKVSKGLARSAVGLHRSGQRDLMAEMLGSSAVILPNSVAELEIVVAAVNMPELRARAVVVPNGVSLGEAAEQDGPTSDLLSSLPQEYLLQVANFDPGKNQLNLLRALATVSQIPVVFIGRESNPDYVRACRLLAEKRGNTHFVSHVPHEQMRWFYERARVHALPSLRESPGLATLEASLAGANCVVSIHGPIVEYFGRDAWFCDPLKPESIREAVEKAWNAPRTTGLRNRILEEFTWAKAAGATLRGYHLALEQF